LIFTHKCQDEPPLAKEGGDLDWEEELHRLVKLERILGYQNVAEKVSNFFRTFREYHPGEIEKANAMKVTTPKIR
jgi:hypothetical protein